MRIKVPGLVTLVLLIGTSSFSQAQIFRVQGGTSSLFGADGGSLEVKSSGYEGRFGLGVLNGEPQHGFQVRTRLFGDTLTVGDDTIKVELPTDVFDNSHYFLARGIGLQREADGSRWYGFLGTSSLGYSTPFFMASRSERGLGILYLDRPLSSTLRFVSRTLLTKRQTSIHALEWKASPGLRVATSAGVGSGQPYLATSLKFDRDDLVIRAAYIAEGDEFQRMQVPSPISTELEKQNVAVAYRVNRRLTLQGSHENIIQPATVDTPLLRAKVNEGYATLNAADFDFGGGLIHSSSTSGGNLGINVYAIRAINEMFSVNANFYQSRPQLGSISNTVTTTVRERLTQRLALTQTLVRSNGQTTTGVGGELIGNRFNAFVGYQTVYVPFRPDRAFQQTLNFSARCNLPHNMQLTASSFLDPQGRMRYTLGIGAYVYRLRGLAGPVSSAESFRFPKFVVKGKAVDTDGNPVEGAAIYVDGKVAYSDTEGAFMIRLPRTGPYSLSVALDEFISPGSWDVVEAPKTIFAQPEERVTSIVIVLRRKQVS